MALMPSSEKVSLVMNVGSPGSNRTSSAGENSSSSVSAPSARVEPGGAA